MSVVKVLSRGEPVDQIEGPLGLVIGHHMARVADQHDGKVTNGFGVAGKVVTDVPEMTNQHCIRYNKNFGTLNGLDN